MNSSKIIKTEDNDRSGVKNFLLKQFPGNDNEDENGKNKKRHPQKGCDPERLDAKRIKFQAQQEAKLIIEKAQKDAEMLEKKAFESGFSQGEQEGRQKAEDELATLISSFKKILLEFENMKQRFYVEHQDVVLELALKIARKIIHQEVRSNKDFLMGVLTSAIKLAVDRERLEIRVNPEDMDLCLRKRLDIIKEIDGIKQIVYEPDENVDRGGAIVECAFGEIDARLDQQFAEVERSLKSSNCDTAYNGLMNSDCKMINDIKS
jgi:flagellar assembly protein FliH